MSGKVLYKRLVIVDILHGYYLDQGGLSYFSLPVGERVQRLEEVVQNDRYGIMDQIFLEPTAATKRLFGMYQIIFKKSTSGFFLGVAVEEIQQDNETRYKPLIPFDVNMKMQFRIRAGGRMGFITNTRFRPVFPALYYATNGVDTPGKVYPSLSVPPAAFQSGYFYQMGETVSSNTGTYRAVKNSTSIDEGWVLVDNTLCMGEDDRILLPKAFTYQIQAPGITSVKFELKSDANVVKLINVENDQGVREASLNFQKADDLSAIEAGHYILSITGNNDFELQHKIYLDDKIYSSDSFGMVEIVLNADDPSFQLLDENGMLSHMYEPLCPRFELRLMNRSTYWKYYFEKDQSPVVDPLWEDTDVPAGFTKGIASTIPYPIAQDYRKITYGQLLLPNPVDTSLSLKGDKIYSDILIN